MAVRVPGQAIEIQTVVRLKVFFCVRSQCLLDQSLADKAVFLHQAIQH